MSTPRRAPRNTLSRARVIAAAMELADADGVAALTIRALAARLEVRPMSLYHYVATKEELLDALVEQVYAEMERPDPTAGDWRAELVRRGESVRALLLRHPWALWLLETRTAPERPAALGHAEAVLATLLAGGCPPEVAVRAHVLLDSYVYGFVLQELTMASTDPHSDNSGELAVSLEAGPYPSLRAAMSAVRADDDYVFADAFAPGLEVVLDGVERWTASAAS
ncbi:MAG: TetR/AcrR family transcriptional regulator [Nocardioides sp.]|nr:TetR/AcrR family transcriptional regulator [Nocardioides sp.]